MKSKVIATMMTALFLTFAIIAPPLFSVPTVSASTLKLTFWEWGVDFSNLDLPPFVFPPFDPFTAAGDALLCIGRIEGGISATMWVWSTPLTGIPPQSAVFHWHQDFLWVFDNGGWVTGWYDGVWPPNTMRMTFQGRITGASNDKTNYIGCKITSGKCYFVDTPPSPLLEWRSIDYWLLGEWGAYTFWYVQGTGSLSGSLNK